MTSTFVFFMFATVVLNYALDSFSVPHSIFRDGLMGGLLALFWITFFKFFHPRGQKSSWIDPGVNRPFDD